jgi:hypothetical protein
MPIHPEMQLLSRIFRTGSLKEVLEWGITANDFSTSIGKGLWSHLYGFYLSPDTRGAVLGLNTIQLDYPGFSTLCDDSGMTTESLCKIVRETRVVLEGKNYLNKALDDLEVDPSTALLTVRRRIDELIELGGTKNLDVSFSDTIQDIVIDYERAKAGVATSKVTWPWQLLNEEMGGLLEDDYIVLYGRPKSLKSWVLSYLIAHFFYTLELRVLVYTKEMTPKNIFRRIAASIGKLPYQEMRFGKMTQYETDALYDIRDMAQELNHKDNLWCLSGKDTPNRGAGDTVPWLMTKVEKYRPDVVMIDGLYLMSTGKTNQKDNIRVQTISRECRQMVLDTGIPVIATAQANRQAAGHQSANLDEIAHSDAIGQDATAAFRVINEKHTPTVILATAGSREFKMDGFRINAIPATDFTFDSLISEHDLEKAKEKDTGDQEPEKRRRAPASARIREERIAQEQIEKHINRMKQH